MRKFQTGIKCSLVAEVENLIMLLACRNCVVEKVLKDLLQNQIMHWRGGETIKEDSLDEGVNKRGCGVGTAVDGGVAHTRYLRVHLFLEFDSN